MTGSLPGRVVVADAAAMRELGARIAGQLRPGDLLLAVGPLGAGKTTLVQGIGAGLGVQDRVLSPTFVIAREHRDGRVPLVHVDAYRLGMSADPLTEIDSLDLDTSLADAVVVVEWGEGLVEGLAGDHLVVRIDPDGRTDTRLVTLTGSGLRWDGVVSPADLP